jgi:uncharacterized protein (TIGR02301 family)
MNRLCRLGRAAPLLLAALALAGTAVAQPQAQSDLERDPDRQYRAAVIALGQVLGEAHYLRTLCGGADDQRWRDSMVGLISREPRQRQALQDAFNAGYRVQASRHPTCTRAAQAAEQSVRQEGSRLADELSARHQD